MVSCEKLPISKKNTNEASYIVGLNVVGLTRPETCVINQQSVTKDMKSP